MPRNASGTFSLVSGNPVVSGTLIDATWANNTLNDIANEMTDSLSRSGEGGMLAPLRLTDGVQATPGLGFTNEPGSGIYRAGTNEWWSVAGGAQVQQHTANGAVTRFAAGAVGTPSLSAFGDVNTGLWVPAADTLAASVGGVEALRVSSAGVLSLVNNPTLSGGTANGVLYLNGSKAATSGSALTFDGTTLIASAGSPVVRATASTTGALYGFEFNGGALDAFIKAQPSNAELRLSSGRSAGWGGFMSFYTDTSERMRLDLNGNLGIGTSSPGARLDVVTGTARWRISNDGSGNIIDEVLDSTGAAYRDYKLYGLNLISYTSGAERMRLDTSGNLGIGTSSPSQRLHLVGGNYRQNDATNSFGFEMQNGTGTSRIVTISGGSAFAIQSGNNGVDYLNLDGNGSVTIGSNVVATNATNGFLYVPTCAGVPTGTPTAKSGYAPIVVDTTNNRWYFYSGGAWRNAGP